MNIHIEITFVEQMVLRFPKRKRFTESYDIFLSADASFFVPRRTSEQMAYLYMYISLILVMLQIVYLV